MRGQRGDQPEQAERPAAVPERGDRGGDQNQGGGGAQAEVAEAAAGGFQAGEA